MTDRGSHQVFISYSDRRGALMSAVIELVLSRLEENGVVCWARHRDVGKKSLKERRRIVEEAVRSSRICVVVVDGRREQATPENNWQIEYAIANELTIVPFCLRKPEARNGANGTGWLDNLDEVLDERLGELVLKVQTLLGEDSEDESIVEEAEERDEEEAEETIAGGVNDDDLADEEELGASDEEAQEEAPGLHAPDRDEVTGEEVLEADPSKVSFPLPPPKVGIKGRLSRRHVTAHSAREREDEEEEREKVDYPRRRKKSVRESGGRPGFRSEDGLTAENGEEESPGIRKTAPLLAAAIVAILTLVGIQVVSSRKSATGRERNMHELEMLGFSLNMYAVASDGKFPDSIEDLENLVNDGSSLRWRDYDAHTEEEFLYFPGYSWNDSEWVVLAAAPRPTENGRRAVLYLSAGTRWMLEGAFQRRLAAGTIGPAKSLSKAEK